MLLNLVLLLCYDTHFSGLDTTFLSGDALDPAALAIMQTHTCLWDETILPNPQQRSKAILVQESSCLTGLGNMVMHKVSCRRDQFLSHQLFKGPPAQ